MRATITIYDATLDEAMQYAEQFEIVANVHVTGFTHKSDGTVEIHYEENDVLSADEAAAELEYIDVDDDWPDEYIDYPDWDEDI